MNPLINLFTYQPIDCNKLFITRKRALTLAEVLITLGIIGIVSAMTIPTLYTNYQKRLTLTRLKKTYSQLNQLVKTIDEENGLSVLAGRPSDFVPKYILPHFAGATLYSASPNHEQAMCHNPKHAYYAVKNRKAQYNSLVSGGYCAGYISTPFMPSYTVSVELPDGTCIGFNQFVNNTNLYPYGTIFVDVNGSANPPNCFGKDLFFFYYDENSGSVKAADWYGSYNAYKIIKNGWTFPKSYPWKAR